MRPARLIASVLPVLLTLIAGATVASARVPQGFVGVLAAPPLFDRGMNLAHQLDAMVASGVESLRVEFIWNAAQPYATSADVPPSQAKNFQTIGGVPTSFKATDPIVGLAAQRGLSILPDVLVTPEWAALPRPPGDYALPRSNATYAHFLSDLVHRYGPHGSYWRENPKIKPRPIRMWQIWNEPNLTLYWSDQPFAPGYVKMLRATHDAIKRADPHAKVVLAGLPNFAWEDVQTIYNVRGAHSLFDAVAVHPFTATPQGVITILEKMRAVMNKNGDRHKPLMVTELSWPSAEGKSTQHFGIETTEAGQARNVAAVLPMLAANRRRLGLTAFYYSTWMSRDRCCDRSFEYAGLYRYAGGKITPKPAAKAFRREALAIEDCKAKASVATRCKRR
jgi:arabinogalactan endo-1,4-beta-galactosidase